ncbi:unnamed protein product [Chrysoparadoxa australica]
MGAKKGGEKKGGARGEKAEGEDPLVLLSNYVRFSKLIGVPPNPKVVQQLQDEEHYPLVQLVVDDEHGPLGPGGTRALTTAVLGTGQDMKGGSYKLKGLRLWRTRCGDEGARSIAELLRLGGAEVQLEFLELFENQVSIRGATALGQALCIGCNKSLLTLKLDYNLQLGSEGMAALCRGLRTNSTLKQLHVPYCAIDASAGPSIGEMLSFSSLGLTVLNLQGNQLGGKGVQDLSPGLARNKSLTYLNMADNGISGSEEDCAALELFRDALVSCPTLTHIDILYNRIGEKGAQVMLPALAPENQQIKQFFVDASVGDLFHSLHRRDAGGKGGKGKKGGKKKK